MMGRFRVSHSYMGVSSILSKLFYTHHHILTYIMGRFMVSHSCHHTSSIVQPCIMALAKVILSFLFVKIKLSSCTTNISHL